MKFLHLGDLHLGKRLNEFDLIEDQKYILDQILDMAKEQQVDAVLIAGDVYDKSVPSESAVNLLDYFLRRLVEANLKAFMISGNHDSDERLQFGSSMFEASGLFVAGKYQGELVKQEMEDEFGKLNVYLLPFVKASYVRKYFPEADMATYDDAVRTVIEQADVDANERNLIVAHQFVVGKNHGPELAGSEGLPVQNVGLVEQVHVDTFDDFDYVALGHIHSGQRISRDEVRYSGSPLKYSLSEVNSKKSVPIITMGAKGDVDIELLPLTPKRELRHLTGEMNVLLKKENVVDIDDFIYITLTDENPVSDPMGIIREYYPNVVKLDFRNSHTQEIDEFEFASFDLQKSFEDLIGDFYRQIYGEDITDEEMKIMKQIAGEAGVEHEAD